MYKGGETKTLKEEYKERSKYKLGATSQYKNKVIDTWHRYPNYGFFNSKYEVVTPNVGDNYENLVQFGDYADPSQRALPFVVTAFDELRAVILERAQAPGFSIPSYFGDFSPKKSYENFQTKYNQYFQSTVSKFEKASASDPESFLQEIVVNANVFPMTQSGFALSRHCPISTTGLAIELATLSHDIDSIKGELINKENYSCFVEDAYALGFYVDKNNPWRLIANMNSQAMQSRIELHRPGTSAENILQRLFHRKVHFEDIQSIYKLFLRFNLTSEQILSYTIKVRMAEIGMPLDMYTKINEEVQNIFKIYSPNYPSDPFKGSASILANYCSEFLKEIYEKKARIDSHMRTRIKDIL